MLIDWFTVAAQVINFLILVWLLKRFLYKPILNAIDAREQRIALALADADAKKAEALQERDTFRHKNETFDQQRTELMSQIADEAKVERQRLLDEALQAAEVLRTQRQDALSREQQSLNVEIMRRTREEVFAIARKVLMDLATTSLEQHMGELFTRRLQGMDVQSRDDFAKALKTSSAPMLVSSAFEMPAEQRAAILQVLNEIFSADCQVRFVTAPDLISGIELSVNGRKLAWSITDYLVSLEKSVNSLLQTPINIQDEAKGINSSKMGAIHQ